MSKQANPFNRVTMMIIIIIGFAAFVGLLFGLGAGNQLANSQNGQAHGASNSYVGYKALANLISASGVKVQYSRNPTGNDNSGLLVITPNPYTDAEKLAEVVHNRSYTGPTLIILPKWNATQNPLLKKGWVAKGSPIEAETGVALLADLADVEITVDEDRKIPPSSRSTSAISAAIKTPNAPVTMAGDYIRTIVKDPKSGDALVGYIDDGGVYAQLDLLDPSQISEEDEIDEDYYPIVIVADADLLNNGGMANKKTAQHALELIQATSAGADEVVTFDLTFNGLGASQNLLTLAFQPPFLSATLCLIAAALAAAWMAFNRFGPPLREHRSINYGKSALVHNSAGFINRMQRQYLVAEPYAEMIRNAAIKEAGIAANLDDAEQNDDLDNLGEVEGYRFSSLYHALNRAQNSREVADRAAALLHWKKEKIG